MGRYRDKSTNISYEEKPIFPVDQGETETRKRTGVIANTPSVHLREEASRDSKSLAILREGCKIDILDNGIETNDFKHVAIKSLNLVGYIVSKFCKEMRS